MPARHAFSTVLFLAGCAPAMPAAELPAEDENGLLGGAVLLPLTTRSSAGLLGHVWSDRDRKVEASRRVLAGEARHDETRQRVEALRSAELLASLGAAGAGIGGEVAGRERTDVAYSVEITSYETLEPEPASYAPQSGCCVNGRVAEACEGGYVGRVLRGSGNLRFLRRISATAAASLGPVLSARGGANFELLDETRFDDAFFALMPEPLDRLCARIAPEQELEPIRVVAAHNCLVRIYDSSGKSSRLAHDAYYPSAAACWLAAERVCSAAQSPVACPATYREADGSLTVRDFMSGNSAAPAPPAAPPQAAPAGAE